MQCICDWLLTSTLCDLECLTHKLYYDQAVKICYTCVPILLPTNPRIEWVIGPLPPLHEDAETRMRKVTRDLKAHLDNICIQKKGHSYCRDQRLTHYMRSMRQRKNNKEYFFWYSFMCSIITIDMLLACFNFQCKKENCITGGRMQID